MSDYGGDNRGGGGFGDGGSALVPYKRIQALVISFVLGRTEFELPETIDDKIAPPLAELPVAVLEDILSALARFLLANGVEIAFSAAAVKSSQTWDDIALDIFKRQKPKSSGGRGGGVPLVRAPDETKVEAPGKRDRDKH